VITARLDDLVRSVALRRSERVPGPILVAISGIDGAGKGTLATQLAGRLREAGLAAAEIGLDSWLEPRERWSDGVGTGDRFYAHGFRFDEMFIGRVEPLRRDLSVDVILLEGIFLFKHALRRRYDLTIWVDCPQDVALARAYARNQEGLPQDKLRHDYERIYVPAQKVHALRDEPRAFAEIVFVSPE